MPSSFPTAAKHLLLNTADGFRHTATALALKKLCFSSLRLENSKEGFLTVLDWITAHPCVCGRPHPLNLYHQNRGGSVSPKDGHTVKNRRERSWEGQITEAVGRPPFCYRAHRCVQKYIHIHTFSYRFPRLGFSFP